MRSTPRLVEPDVSALARLLADESRTAMLFALADGRALPAGDLARCASISAQTASEHLGKLHAAGLLEVVRQGRHRYFRIANERIGVVLETMASIAPQAAAQAPPVSRVSADLRAARLCFGHLAGAWGVALARSLVERGRLSWCEAGYMVTEAGLRWLAELGADAEGVRAQKPAVRTCHVDWSERRPHVSGPFGTTLTRWLMSQEFLVPVTGTRALRVSSLGARWFGENGVDASYSTRLEDSGFTPTARIAAARSAARGR